MIKNIIKHDKIDVLTRVYTFKYFILATLSRYENYYSGENRFRVLADRHDDVCNNANGKSSYLLQRDRRGRVYHLKHHWT